MQKQMLHSSLHKLTFSRTSHLKSTVLTCNGTVGGSWKTWPKTKGQYTEEQTALSQCHVLFLRKEKARPGRR